MPEPTHGELLAEVKVVRQKVDDHIEHSQDRYDRMEERLDEIHSVQSRQQGWIAGVAAAFTAVWAVVIVFAQKFVERIMEA